MENRKEKVEGNHDDVVDDEFRVPRRLLERISKHIFRLDDLFFIKKILISFVLNLSRTD